MRATLIVIIIIICGIHVPHYAFSLSKKEKRAVQKQVDEQIRHLQSYNPVIATHIHTPYTVPKTLPNLDYDNDGINNHYDHCYTLPGIPERNGCPDIDMTKIITVLSPSILFTDEEFGDAVQAFANLEFAKHLLSSNSHLALDKFVQLLQANAKWTICMSVYVDEFTSDKTANTDLSKKRFEAVQKYLIKKGIAKKRINGKYFGDTMPVIDLPPTRFEVEIGIDTTTLRKAKAKAKKHK